jgi:hypothetical protein
MQLRVMAEYGSSGIWVVARRPGGLFRHGMIEYADLGLSTALSAEFASWVERYEHDNPNGDLDTEAFNAEGRRLANALKAFLGTAYSVEFQGEADDGSLMPSEVIP